MKGRHCGDSRAPVFQGARQRRAPVANRVVMPNPFNYRYPQCGGQDEIEICAFVAVTLTSIDPVVTDDDIGRNSMVEGVTYPEGRRNCDF
jgi:hypothetical protein